MGWTRNEASIASSPSASTDQRNCVYRRGYCCGCWIAPLRMNAAPIRNMPNTIAPNTISPESMKPKSRTRCATAMA